MAAAPTSAEGEKMSLKDQGNEFFKSGKYLKAAAIYTQAIKQDPSNATLYRYPSFQILQLDDFVFLRFHIKVDRFFKTLCCFVYSFGLIWDSVAYSVKVFTWLNGWVSYRSPLLSAHCVNLDLGFTIAFDNFFVSFAGNYIGVCISNVAAL